MARGAFFLKQQTTMIHGGDIFCNHQLSTLICRNNAGEPQMCTTCIHNICPSVHIMFVGWCRTLKCTSSVYVVKYVYDSECRADVPSTQQAYTLDTVFGATHKKNHERKLYFVFKSTPDAAHVSRFRPTSAPAYIFIPFAHSTVRGLRSWVSGCMSVWVLYAIVVLHEVPIKLQTHYALFVLEKLRQACARHTQKGREREFLRYIYAGRCNVNVNEFFFFRNEHVCICTTSAHLSASGIHKIVPACKTNRTISTATSQFAFFREIRVFYLLHSHAKKSEPRFAIEGIKDILIFALHQPASSRARVNEKCRYRLSRKCINTLCLRQRTVHLNSLLLHICWGVNKLCDDQYSNGFRTFSVRTHINTLDALAAGA